MKCTTCLPKSLQKKLSLEAALYDDYHDSADLLKCPTCSAYYLNYWVEIYDDSWNYWIELNDEEHNVLNKTGNKDLSQAALISFIRTKENVICMHPSGKYYIMDGAACMLDGAPW